VAALRIPTFVRPQYQPTCRILSIPYVDKNLTALYQFPSSHNSKPLILNQEDTETVYIISDQTAQVSSNQYVPVPTAAPQPYWRHISQDKLSENHKACCMVDKGRSAIRSPCRRHAGEPCSPKSFAAGTVQGYWEMEMPSSKPTFKCSWR
jgi:hypothetical protein